MQNENKFTRRNNQLFTIGLVAGMLLAYSEVSDFLSAEPAWDKLLTPSGSAAIIACILFVLISLATLYFSLWKPALLRSLAKKMNPARWLIAVLLIGFFAWVYLFSPWQTVLTFPWTQFLVAAGLARLLGWFFSPEQDQPFGWGDLALAFAFFLYPRLVQEARIIYPVALVSRGSIVAGALFLLLLIAFLYLPAGDNVRGWFLAWRQKLARWQTFAFVLAVLLPFIYRYSIGAGGYILYPNFRFAVFLIALWAAAYFFYTGSDRLVTLESMVISTGWIVLVSVVTRSLLLVVDDPFGLYWSEGNRLYDYSLIFGQDLYNYAGQIQNPYASPGRYGLWGVLFLWTGLPIWAHRLWNVTLLTLPSIVLAWALTAKLTSSALRHITFLWVSIFFILLAPLHPPFMVMTIMVAFFVFHPSPYVRGGSLVAASLYAGISRWTWVFAPGAWGALADLFLFYPKREGNWFKRLLPTVLMAVLGAAPGFLLNIGNFFGYAAGESTTAQQPLLWYRLLPNQTLGPGIVLLVLLTTGPVVAVLLYKMISRQWKFDAFQMLAIWGALIGFFGVGLVVSTKIGGGGDLHNLDMYIGTLIMVAMLGLASQAQGADSTVSKIQDVTRLPAWVLAMLCYLLLLPAYQFSPFHPGAASHQWLDLPSREQTDMALSQIRTAVDEASKQGEVLFMDQRQLLTFGYMPNIPFVPEYEKKYMMDQAMASNQTYFRPYYQDLANRRFSLIVTEPLRAELKDSGIFSEENDLWVVWVSAPTLCFYEPLMTDRPVGVQLLVPRQEPVDCEKYLQ